MSHQLVVDSVVVRFGEKTVLSGGYITSQTGKVTGLLGRNGTGKSCMFRTLMGGLKVDYVIVHIDGTPIDRKKIGLRIKYLPQDRMIPRGMTLKRAFELYKVDFWEFALRFPQYSGYYNTGNLGIVRRRSPAVRSVSGPDDGRGVLHPGRTLLADIAPPHRSGP